LLATKDPPSPPSGREQRSSPPEPERRPRVWIVDDSALQREIAARVLAERCDVRGFETGAAMLEQIALGEELDVLILDWHMPDMSGAEVCRFVRTQLDSALLPILVLTATSTSEGLLAALEAGANDFVRKPFSGEELNARVATLARTKHLYSRLFAAENRLRIEAEFRERFIGMLAHDLRQPLSAIFMSSQLQQQAGGDAVRFAEMQLRAARRMQRMIGELLDFTRNRPETGIPIQRTSTDFAELAATSVAEIELAQPGTSVTLSVEGPCTGNWDADRLAQVCSNLIGNAIEHSFPNAPVTVSLRGSAAAVSLEVTNLGPPIPDLVRATMFEPFRRGSGRQSKGGVGLGLHIVSQIVLAHQGSVGVESNESGTHFTVNLPKA
jgi:two-component system sensor histidine kinase/response regulator